jgi:hypothetical protein
MIAVDYDSFNSGGRAAGSGARTLPGRHRGFEDRLHAVTMDKTGPQSRLPSIAAVFLGAALCLLSPQPTAGAMRAATAGLLDSHLLITWYGNPHSARMGVLGRASGQARADALRKQAAEFAQFTTKRILMAYHLVAVVAQCTACPDKTWRRRESADTIGALLQEARVNGFKLVLDVQPGQSTVEEELRHLRPFLADPDVYLALDPEFDMSEGQVPGREIGHMHAADVNAAVEFLENLVRDGGLPPKVLIVHQFTLGMLPDKEKIRSSPVVDLVLDMDGFGSQPLKRSSYRAIMRQRQLDFAGIKLFYLQDTNLFSPPDVMSLRPTPSVVIFQ